MTPETANLDPQTADDSLAGPIVFEGQPSGDEFPEGAAEWIDPVSRRRFLGLMSASLALAGSAGCIRPAASRKILPYVRQPDQLTPGVPLFFATAAPLSGYGVGVLVRSREGRPIKIEGNPDHPSSLGGADIFSQASILDLYDPDRSRATTHNGFPAAYDQAVAAVRKALYDAEGKPLAPAKQIRLITESVTSPTLLARLADIQKAFPGAKVVVHDPAGMDNVREGVRRAFGKPLTISYDFTKADVILSLDADFLCEGPGRNRYSRDFAGRRKVRRARFEVTDETIAALKAEHLPEAATSKLDMLKHRTFATEAAAKKAVTEAMAAAKLPADQLQKVQDAVVAHANLHDGVTPEGMSRLYAVECMPTSTGAVADHRLSLSSGQIEGFVRVLARELGVKDAPTDGSLTNEVPGKTSPKDWVKYLVADLKDPARKGKTLVIAGAHVSPAAHALVFAINSQLGNLGQTVIQAPSVELTGDKVISLKTLTQEMLEKKVDALFIFSSNPAYTAPADVPFLEAIKTVPLKLHFGTHQDETAVLCDWHVPEAHYLEAWGDICGHDGAVTIQQPLIKPLYDGKSVIEFLADVTHGPARDGLDIVRNYWRERHIAEKKGGEFEIFWQESVRAGVIAGTAPAPTTVQLAANWAEKFPTAPAASAEGQYELNFRSDPTLYDGRYANNGWLQELPKPLLLICWDNAAYMSQATAEKLGVKVYYRWTAGEHGRADVTVIELNYRDRKIKVPAWILPGHADGAVTIHLGSGRTRAGNYVAHSPTEPNAEGLPVRGFNAYALRTTESLWYGNGLTLAKTSKTYFLASVGGHWSTLDKDFTTGEYRDRQPVRKGTLALYQKNPKFAKITPAAAGETELIDENVPTFNPQHGTKPSLDEPGEQDHDKRLIPLTMYNPNEDLSPDANPDQRRRWGMAIDLSACTGCSACMIACQSENNSPVVGKTEVTRGRIMHWIRIDRYYGGPQETPDANATSFQPVACVQCEKAPCEVVCPVGATVHSVDGLNDMVYNRCVGTRYCSNNCPYKVRRFNFLTFADFNTDTLKLGRNPEVTVRSRGVMEKCSFCVQRIRAAEIVAERQVPRRPIVDGEIMTACQAACPSGAIMFGDLSDAHSAVVRWKSEPTNYGLLAELNTMPRLTHLAALRNPNPNMPKGA